MGEILQWVKNYPRNTRLVISYDNSYYPAFSHRQDLEQSILSVAVDRTMSFQTLEKAREYILKNNVRRNPNADESTEKIVLIGNPSNIARVDQ